MCSLTSSKSDGSQKVVFFGDPNVEQHSLDSDQSLNRKRCCYQFASCGAKNEKKVRKSRPGVLAKKLRRCEEEGGRSKVGRGGSGHAVTPPSYSNCQKCEDTSREGST
jgi:hypothetical protein